jgi:hypothetical protein
MSRALLKPSSLRALQRKDKRKEGVQRRPSLFSGEGVFATQPHAKGDVLCYFRGSLAYPEQPMDSAEERYVIQGPSGDMISPVLPGRARPPASLPGILSGARINEAASVGARDFPANAAVSEDQDGSDSREECPWYGVRSRDWPVYATRNIKAGEELLICYGGSYGPRNYRQSSSCEAKASD